MKWGNRRPSLSTRRTYTARARSLRTSLLAERRHPTASERSAQVAALQGGQDHPLSAPRSTAHDPSVTHGQPLAPARATKTTHAETYDDTKR